MQGNAEQLPRTFSVVLIVTAGLALTLAWPYLGVIAFSLLMVIVFRPIYVWFYGTALVRGSSGRALILTVTTFIVVVLVPIGWVLGIALGEVIELVQAVQSYLQGGDVSLRRAVEQLNAWIRQSAPLTVVQFNPEQVAAALRSIATAALRFGTQLLVTTSTSVVATIAELFIFFAIFTILVPTYETALLRLTRASPLGAALTRRYLDKATAMAWSMFKGVFVIAAVQAAVLGVTLWICGVPYAALLTLVAVVAAVLPGGVNLVGVPIALMFFVTGGYWQGGLLLFACFGVAANIDNYLRPRFVSQEAYLSPPVVLIGTFGGINLFGLWGAIYGPVLMVLFTTTIDLYLESGRDWSLHRPVLDHNGGDVERNPVVTGSDT